MKHIKLKNQPWLDLSHAPGIKKKEILKKNEIPGLEKFRLAIFKPGDKCTEHSHSDFYEVFYVTKGSGQININSKILEVGPRETIVVEPEEKHWVANIGSEDFEIVYFALPKS